MEQIKQPYTLCLVHQHPRVLLGYKKRGFGAGRWNGFGGKVKDGETIEEAARREILEEAGIRVNGIQEIGNLEFEFQKEPGFIHEVHVFKSDGFEGDLIETEEMKPKWFHIDEVPFSYMWPDDKYWFPLFLGGKSFSGRFLFGEDDKILDWKLKEI